MFRIYKQYFSPGLPFNYCFPYIFYSSAVILAWLASYLLFFPCFESTDRNFYLACFLFTVFFLVLNLQIVIFAWLASCLLFFPCFESTDRNFYLACFLFTVFFLVLNLQIVIFAWLASCLLFFPCFNPTGSNSSSNLLNIYCL